MIWLSCNLVFFLSNGPFPMTATSSFDVLIIGGGVIGSSIAFFLAEEDAFSGSVAVMEKDPTYADGSTARSVGGIRQQFSTPESIEMSKFGAAFFKSVPHWASGCATVAS